MRRYLIGTAGTAQLEFSTMSFLDYAELTETAVGSGVFTNETLTVRLSQILTLPRLTVSDGMGLTNAIFTVWETAPQSDVFRNYNEAIPTNLSPQDLAVPDFVPWRLKITGLPDSSLIEGVSITTSLDSTDQITFSSVNGSLLSDQKFIIIPDGNLIPLPSQDYVPIRSDVETPGTVTTPSSSVVATLFLAGCSPVKKEEIPEIGALVLESLPSYENWGTSTYRRFVKPLLPFSKGPFQEMGYTVTPELNASTSATLEDYIKGKQVWYSLSHGRTTDNTPKEAFIGLEFKDGELITAAKLLPLRLDYRLVLADACCSAQTSLDFIEDARDKDELLNHAKSFANSFGPNVAYVGWAWEMNPGVAQKWTKKLVEKLKYDKTLKRGRTVAEAYQALLSEQKVDSPEYLTLKLMKLHGATNNVIDLRKETK